MKPTVAMALLCLVLTHKTPIRRAESLFRVEGLRVKVLVV